MMQPVARCWAVFHRDKVVQVLFGAEPPDPEGAKSAMAWAWAVNSRRGYQSSGVELPGDYRRAKRCGYRIGEVFICVER